MANIPQWPTRLRPLLRRSDSGSSTADPAATSRVLATWPQMLQVRFGAEVQIEEGRFGQFDVLLDGKLVASKGGFWRRVTIHGAPPQERLLASIEKHLAVREGDFCEIEPAHQAGRPGRQAR